jgi:hypothetical protein
MPPLPAVSYVVADKHLRRVGKDCLVSFERSLLDQPGWRRRRPSAPSSARRGGAGGPDAAVEVLRDHPVCGPGTAWS